MTSAFDAIVLAGGRGSRMSGRAKPQLAVGDATMLERVLSAVRGAGTRIVVGPPQPAPDGVLVVQEQTPGSGPVAGVAAGLDHLSAQVVVVLAADLPFVTVDVVSSLLSALTGDPEVEAALLVDENGRDQYLLGAWRVDRLRRALAGLEPLPGRAMRDLVRAARVTRIEVPPHGAAPPPWTDIDTPADLYRARGRVQRGGPNQR